VKVTPTINCPVGQAFDYIIGVGLTDIFRGRATRRHRPEPECPYSTIRRLSLPARLRAS
jgi:hypothetical protein